MANYRPVSNLPFLGKVIERVVAEQLQACLEEADHLDPFQSGFRPHHGTETALVALVDDLRRARDKEPVKAVKVLCECLEAAGGWMAANRLRLNPDKTEVLFLGDRRQAGVEDSLVLNWVTVSLKDQVCSLGVILDSQLSMEAQVKSVSRAVVYQLHLVRRLRPYLPADCLARVVHALVISRLDYCNALYVGLPLKVTRKLQLIQNAAARLVTGSGHRDHITPVLKDLHWLPVRF
ncbi:uncharacterized protein LOC128403862 [Podarcis raffonei]|uniref:uncharacterized protein LOC128403862 n=1 Tax=Podarcis raffonei TaxID=65483 RepID=UPI0023295B26|nr:uncharacterized protein LOC128403862 [Podarcis raffonei]